MIIDLRDFVRWITDEFEPAARVGGLPGAYARRIGEKTTELYGVADMACILYTIDHLAPDEPTLARWRAELDALQDPQSGYILERRPTHHRLHNTAFALGAMHLLGQHPATPLHFVDAYRTADQIRAFLNGLDWRNRVYGDSHQGAGLAAALALTEGEANGEWFKVYFDTLDALIDPRNGMMGLDKPAGGDTDQIGGTFHYAFLYEHFNRPIPAPAARVDAICALQQSNGLWNDGNPWWLTLDAVYLLSRSADRFGRRGAAADQAIRRAVANRYENLLDPAARRDAFFSDLGVHRLTAAVSLFAEAQRRLGPREILTDRPLRLVLDERPFI